MSMQVPRSHILLVDDDRIIQFAVRKALQAIKAAQDVKSCFHGLEALEYLQKTNGHPALLPDLILLDLNMPIMNGYGFLEKYQQLTAGWCKRPLLYVVSSSIDEADLVRSLAYDCVADYVSKPMTKEVLRSVLASVGDGQNA